MLYFSFYKLKCTLPEALVKLVKKRLRNRLCDKTLDEAMRTSIKGQRLKTLLTF